ncbi:hypothetical protein BC628DRAFT_1348851 [Trametes gibbosa]|nr:hypothetical protein BC628DRAFT_1348851 [Trametes gibbosa]
MATLSPHYRLDAPLSGYFTVAVFHNPGGHSDSAASSRPSSSSSSSDSGCYPSPASTTYTDSPSAYASSSRPASRVSSPSTHSPSRPRPLPTPPSTASSVRPAPLPRPLPRPPLVRADSDPARPMSRSIPLPTPPTVPEYTLAPAPPPRLKSSNLCAPVPTVVSETVAAGPAVRTTPAATPAMARPTMSLSIPVRVPRVASGPPQLSSVSPLSPIAFDFAGSSELRQRREVELDRCMKDLGFIDVTPHAPLKASSAPSDKSPSRSGCHVHSFSIDSESDEECDVVLLVDEHPDSEDEAPQWNDSRAALLTLFPDVDIAPSPIAQKPSQELTVDVQVEIISKAAARSKRRFSRKWVREKSGKRWTEKDFSEILSQLRKLR